MTGTKMLPARGNEGGFAATTSQMEESEAKQWLRSTGAILRRCSGIWKRTGTTYFFPHIPKHLNCTPPMSGVVIVGVSVDFKVSCSEPLCAIRKEIWKEL